MKSEISFNYKILILFNILLSIFAICYIIFVDIPLSIQTMAEQGLTFRIWYLDDALLKIEGKGPGMVTAIIFDIIAGFFFIYCSYRISIIRKVQSQAVAKIEKKYLMSNVYYSIVLLSIARILEATYILTETDAKAILMVGLRIHIPLDTIAMAIFFSVCADVFYTYELETKKTNRNWIVVLSWFAIIAGWTRIYIEMIENSVVERISEIFFIAVLIVIAITSIAISRKAKILSEKIEDKDSKIAIKKIGIILLLFVLTTALSIVIFVTFPNLTQYIMRTIKNIAFTIIAMSYFPAFVYPAEKKYDIRPSNKSKTNQIKESCRQK